MFVTTSNRMMRLGAALFLSALVLATCGGDDSAPSTTGAPAVVTVVELDTAVGAAAQALLESPFLEATVAYFDFEDPDYVYRFHWMDARPNGDQVVVDKDIDSNTTIAYAQVAGARYTASSTAGDDEPWTAFGPALDPTEGALPLHVVTQMADGATLVMAADSVPDDATITRQAGADGSTVWRLTTPSASTFRAAEWIIDRDGLLWFYRVESDQAPIADAARAIIIGFAIPDNAAPISPPRLGTPLDLEDYGVPPDLWDSAE